MHVHLREPVFRKDHCDRYGLPPRTETPPPLSDARISIRLPIRQASGSGAGSDPPRYGRSECCLAVSITRGQKGRGELVDFGALAGEVVGFSDDGRGAGRELMAEAMRRAAAVGKPIVAHCEVDELLKGEGISTTVFIARACRAGDFICSGAGGGRWKRDIKLARPETDRYHVTARFDQGK